ncbi:MULTISPECIES: glycosyltransferase family 2 protein [unclassified Caballeronia]|uniref:glycosyltransferase family 2 protein n=1 Tax=unclassified Caballeronia TaxID=2646786 RepID=UPI002028AA88|nr:MULTISPECIES: glycosyltransferase family 2 protein [unclassified Caballeronia]
MGGKPPVSAVIVTFNPNVANVVAILDALEMQVERVAIVDNGSATLVSDALTRLAQARGCVFVGLGANLGIAAAQNRGADEVVALMPASSQSARFILFLDHDSLPTPDMVAHLLATDARMRDQGERVGAVGPLTLDKRTRTAGRFMQAGTWWIRRRACRPPCLEMKVDFLISSGTLIRVDVLRDVGGMNEGLFIDHVDTEWCVRAVNRGYALFGACHATLLHSLGDEVIRVWLLRWREVFVHSPLRDYYMCRNTLAIMRTIPMTFAWRLFLLTRLASSIVFFGFVASPRLTRWRMMWAGLVDGCSGKSGPR